MHGGEKFASSVVITDEVLAAVEECNDLMHCTAVSATTPSISFALHPRDKSLTGAAIPCVSGPYASAFASLCTSL